MDAQPTNDISDYIAALKRRRMLLALVALPICGLAMGLTIGLPDQYVSTSLIEFAQAEISGELPNRGRQEKSYADQYVSSLSDAVLNKENLERRLAQPGAPARLAGEDMEDFVDRIAGNASVETVRVPVLDPDSGREREIVSAFTVSYQSRDPKTAHQVAAWLTEAFLRQSRDVLQQRAASSAQFYTAEVERYGAQIGKAEAKLAEFKAKNFGKLPELTDVNLTVMDRTERDLETIEMQLSTLRHDRIFLASQLEQARNEGPDTNLLSQLEAEYAQKSAIYDPDHPDLVNLRRQIESLRRGGPSMQNMSLQQQLAAQQTILSQVRERYSADHPDVKRIQRQIDTLQRRIAAGEKSDPAMPVTPTVMQLRTQVSGIDTQISGLQQRATELRGKLDKLVQRMEATPTVEREYQTLTRDLQIARTQYDELLKSRMGAQLTEAAIAGGRSDELHLVQPPITPSAPAKPARLAIAIVGMVLATLIGLAAVVFAEGMDQTVRGSRDVRRVLSVSPLAVIPEILDAAAARRKRLKVVTLASCTVIGSVILVVTLRSLS